MSITWYGSGINLMRHFRLTYLKCFNRNLNIRSVSFSSIFLRLILHIANLKEILRQIERGFYAAGIPFVG